MTLTFDPVLAADLAAGVPRRPTPLVVEAAASENGVRLIEHVFAGPVRGAAFAGDTIVLDARLRGFNRQWVFAHELGHIIAQRHDLRAAQDERFADDFARHYLLPALWASAHERRPLSLARRLNVGLWLVAAQLSSLGLLPKVLRHGGSVVCGRCGLRSYESACGCTPARRSFRARQALPSAIDLLTDWAGEEAIRDHHNTPLWDENVCRSHLSGGTFR